MRFGRLSRRLDEMRGSNYLAALESLTGKQVPEKLRREIMRGANELDLIRSGLDDTIRMAFHDILEIMRKNPNLKDYRTAAFAIAITKMAQSYYELGLAEAL
jgi:glutamate dehydrogenase (NAD(P)+)